MIDWGGGFRFGAVWGRLSLVELDYGAVWCGVGGFFFESGRTGGCCRVVLCWVGG